MFSQRLSDIRQVWMVVTSAQIRNCFSRAERRMQRFRVVVLQIISPIIGHYLSLLEFPLSCSLDTAARRGAKFLAIALHNDIRISPFILLSHKRLIVYSNSLFSSSAYACACTHLYRTGARSRLYDSLVFAISQK